MESISVDSALDIHASTQLNQVLSIAVDECVKRRRKLECFENSPRYLTKSNKLRCALSPKITHENGGILLDGTIVNKTRAKNVDHQLSSCGSSMASGKGIANSDGFIGLVYDPEQFRHKHSGRRHPENPERITAIMKELKAQGVLSRCRLISAELAEDEVLRCVHSEHYLRRLHALLGMPSSAVEAETEQYDSVYMNQHSVDCARRAAGGLISLTRAVLNESVKCGMALIRPPGHHAESHGPKGFCLLNNVAAAAAWARNQGVAKILIVDWDVHHGNGTQSAFYSDPTVMYCSIHRHDNGRFFPGGKEGSYRSVGSDAGTGYNVNIAWEGSGAGDIEYLEAMRRIIIPLANQYKPELVFVSAGFDASIGDFSMGGCKVSPSGYAMMTRQLMQFANGHVILALEGGYSLRSLGQCVTACCKVLLSDLCDVEIEPTTDHRPVEVSNVPVSISALRSIEATIASLEPYWPGLSHGFTT